MNDEHIRTLSDCDDELHKIKKWIDKNPLDTNVRFLVAYAVVKASGTVELVFKSNLHIFLAEDCKGETRTFLEKNIIDLSCNPSTGNMEHLLEQIDTARKELFSLRIKNTQEKMDLNSLVELRNDIAHGRSISVSINTVQRYFESGKAILNKLDAVLYGTPIT